MKVRSLFVLWMVLALGMVTVCDAYASGPTGPRFSWSSFQRFWEKQATPLVYLKDAEPVQDGYLVTYGHGVTLRVLVRDQVVTGVQIRFLGGKANDAGGPQFKRLIYQTITVGSYRWPDDKIEEVRRRFAILSPQEKTYHYQMTRFYYSYSETGGWLFGFDYVPAEQR